ncbi:MAG: ATP synthase F1 subunit delta [Thermodesulfobacteriota bacterium]
MASIAALSDITEALVESAREEGKLDRVTSDVEDFFKLLSDAEEVRNILWSSTFDLQERKGIVEDIGAKRSYDKLTVNFLIVVLELDKFKSLVKSEQTVIEKLRKASGKLRAEVIMAIEPSESDLARIKSALTTAIGRDVEVTSKVDPGIIGGIITKVEDKVFDGSIKTQLERVRNVLTRS